MFRQILQKKGFTLLEIMVAVAILAMISVLSWQSLVQMMNSQAITEDRDEMLAGLRIVFDKMFTDTAQAFLVSADHEGIKQSSQPTFAGASDVLNFATLSGRRYFPGAPGSDQCEVGYYLESDDTDPGTYKMMRRESDWIDDKPDEGGKAYPIIESVKKLQFEYYDAFKKEWKAEWDSSKLSGHKKLPRAIRLTLVLDEKDQGQSIGEKTWVFEFPLSLYAGPLDF